ncbi:MarR family transcriptional regulator [Bacillus salipaludis]|uniref:MarR family transcriptional regulator n=1 Tax=Bacillus salipaludis TaxID=2547811 RepID=A0A4R5W207_9BACI|nr:MarR family transcriptional regulator [Bacillus salipaludis]MDQ6596654.1 MarR family transcriptional regulator [Bacillus salipaludis]TDK65104.1 MarR family transcriptional regulator [Bacillus salipaludis]
MNQDSLQSIEYEIALLVRLTTAYSPKLGDLDRSEYLILSEVNENGPLAINVIAEKLMLNISTASRQVGTLESKQYIKRFPAPDNGRISLIELTNKGQEILNIVQESRYNFYSEVLQNWSRVELKQLEDNLIRLNKDFKNRKG